MDKCPWQYRQLCIHLHCGATTEITLSLTKLCSSKLQKFKLLVCHNFLNVNQIIYSKLRNLSYTNQFNIVTVIDIKNFIFGQVFKGIMHLTESIPTILKEKV